MLSKVALVAAGAVLVAPATSNAADRFASPTGSGTTCDQVTPCDIETAVNKASQFDDVTLTAGTYTPAVTLGIDLSSGFDPKFNLTIHGAPGSRPVVNFSASSAGAFYITTGSSLRDVDVNVTGNSASGVGALNGGIADRVSVHASGADDIACGVTNQSSIRDSVCWYSGSGGPNAAALSSASDIPGFNATNTVRNVTAIAAAGPGMRVRSVSSVNAGVTVNATNVIARGGGGTGGEDVRTERLSGTGDTPPQKVNLDHSNYSTESEQDTGDITDPASGTNLTTAPDFVDAAAGDFREKATSTGTINLGTATGVQNGELALGGQQRNQGGVPDIGADEYDVPNAPSLTGSNPPSGSNENLPPHSRYGGPADDGHPLREWLVHAAIGWHRHPCRIGRARFPGERRGQLIDNLLGDRFECGRPVRLLHVELRLHRSDANPDYQHRPRPRPRPEEEVQEAQAPRGRGQEMQEEAELARGPQRRARSAKALCPGLRHPLRGGFTSPYPLPVFGHRGPWPIATI